MAGYRGHVLRDLLWRDGKEWLIPKVDLEFLDPPDMAADGTPSASTESREVACLDVEQEVRHGAV